jgi:hypothetical protein
VVAVAVAVAVGFRGRDCHLSHTPRSQTHSSPVRLSPINSTVVTKIGFWFLSFGYSARTAARNAPYSIDSSALQGCTYSLKSGEIPSCAIYTSTYLFSNLYIEFAGIQLIVIILGKSLLRLHLCSLIPLLPSTRPVCERSLSDRSLHSLILNRTLNPG